MVAICSIVVMTTTYLQRISEHEDKLIHQFREHPVLVGMDTLSDEHLAMVLGQKAAYSRGFWDIYASTFSSSLSDHLYDPIESIMQEENPSEGPSHYDLCCQDLAQMGLEPHEGSLVTKQVLSDLSGMVHHVDHDPRFSLGLFFDIYTAAVLHLGCEVLAGEEYEAICYTLEKKGKLTETDSVFYWPHWGHDKQGNGSHSTSFVPVFETLVTTEDRITLATGAMDDAYAVKRRFYDQFLRMI
jgi:hypothetical protein